jgi:hypothetical protein
MAYTIKNYKTKKAVKLDIIAGVKVSCYQPGPFSDGSPIQSGTVFLEGPHYPEPHRWYAKGEVVDGRLVSIK